jgi:hypothetical protein
MNIVGLFFIIIGIYLVKLNYLSFNDKEKDKIYIPEKKIKNIKKDIKNNDDISTITEELFWKPSPWEHLHGYKVNIRDKRFY